MERFTSVQGRAIPLMVPDIDTDVITPIMRVMQGGDALTRYAFESLRYTPDGALEPDCPLNQDLLPGRADPSRGGELRLRQLARDGRVGRARPGHPVHHRAELR